MSERSLGSVVIAIRAVDEASSVMEKIKASMGILASGLGELGGGFSSVGSIIQGFAAGGIAGAATAAINEVAKGLQWAIGRGKEMEQVWTNLRASLKLQGDAWSAAKDEVDKYASSLASTTQFSKEEAIGAIQKLATFGMDYKQALEAMKAATELAAAKHLSLETAANLVGKAFIGNTSALRRYGVAIETTTQAKHALAEVTLQLEEKLKSLGTGALVPFSDTLAKAGMSLSDMHGKMRNVHDVVKDLVDAFKAGTINEEQFGEVLKGLGINFDASKLTAADFKDVLAQLNTQFGGEAQAQAKTYEGVQARLSHAMEDLGAKIGTAVLPALTQLTEGMVSAVDWISQGVDAVGRWLDEVGKIPAVKAATDAITDAFQGLWQGIQDFAAELAKNFMPLWEELQKAFKEVWEALQPLFEAFGELRKALFGVGEAGDKGFSWAKLLADVISALVIPTLKTMISVIQFLVPIIRAIGEGIKWVVEVSSPALRALREGIVAFLTAIQHAIQSFVKWLVGGSAWQDMWASMIKVAGEAITNLLNLFTGGLWDKAKAGFSQVFTALADAAGKGLQAIGEGIKTGVAKLADKWRQDWDAVNQAGKAAWDLITSTIQTLAKGAMDLLGKVLEAGKAVVISIFNAMAKGVADAINQVFTVITKLQEQWSGLVDSIHRAIDALTENIRSFLSWLTDIWRTQMAALLTNTRETLNALTDAIQTMGSRVKDVIVMFWGWLTAFWRDQLDLIVAMQGERNAIITRLWLQLMSKLLEVVKDHLAQISEAMKTTAEALLTALQDIGQAMVKETTGFMAALAEIWSIGWNTIFQTFLTASQQILAAFENWWGEVQSITVNALSEMQGQFVSILSAVAATFSAAFRSMVAEASSSMREIVSIVTAALAQVQAATAAMAQAMVHGSIWPEMLGKMESQTSKALDSIVNRFEGAFGKVAGAIPTPATGGPASVSGPAGSAGSLVPFADSQAITIPITVTLDGMVLARYVEQRLVERVNFRGKKVA